MEDNLAVSPVHGALKELFIALQSRASGGQRGTAGVLEEAGEVERVRKGLYAMLQII